MVELIDLKGLYKFVINGCEFNCIHKKELSKYNENYYVLDWKSYGDICYIHTDNFMIREEVDEALNSVTITLGYYDYINNKYNPLIELCNSYNEVMDFGKIIWKDCLGE